MKNSVALALTLLAAYSSAFAQQAPGAIVVHKPQHVAQKPAGVVLPPKPPASQLSQIMQAPAAADPSTLNNKELSDLLRAQTDAIKSLATKLDTLEGRIAVLEKRKK
jgi:hypothetical protein